MSGQAVRALPIRVMTSALVFAVLSGCPDLELPPLGPGSSLCSPGIRAGFFESTPGAERHDLWLAFVDVGHGDATWVRTPGVIGVDAGEILIDAGDDGWPVAPHVPDGGRAVLDLMQRAGMAPGVGLDALVITHPDKDHYGGASAVLSRHPARLVLHGGQPPDTPTWSRLRRRAREIGAVWRTAPDARTGPRPLELGSPFPVRLLFADPHAVDDNDASLVLELTFAGRRIVLMGDAGIAVERRLLDRLEPVALLRTGHHGGTGTSGQPLLSAAVTPQTHAVVSAGRRSGLPAVDVLARLTDHLDDRVWRTDRGDTPLTRRAAAGDDHIVARIAADTGRLEICFLDPDPLAVEGAADL